MTRAIDYPHVVTDDRAIDLADAQRPIRQDTYLQCPYLESRNPGMNQVFNYGHNAEFESSDPDVIKIAK